jgi:alkaline phosphatase D
MLRVNTFVAALVVGVLSIVASTMALAMTEIAAGPMAGARAMRSAVIWLQTDGPAAVRLEYWPEGAPDRLRQTTAVTLSDKEQFTTHVRIPGLEPGQRYRYRVLLDNRQSRIGEQSFTTQALWQWRTDAPDFKVAMGSCSFVNEPDYDRPGRPYGGFYETLENVAKQKPDMMLWLGDNVYLREADWDSPSAMAERYRHTRALKEMQPLLRTGHHYAIWDDHDYGPNNANASYAFKDDALTLFRRYWANPSYGLPGQPGTHSHFSFNDADFFLTEGRWYRDDDSLKGVSGKTMFGHEQVRWLKNALLASTAPFKFIVVGSQVINESPRSEGWHHFRAERDDFFKWLVEQKIDGVMFISGDRHFSALYRQEREGSYPLYDLTCSPLTSGTHNQAFEKTNPRIVAGTLVDDKRNFCTFEFKGSKKDRQFDVQVFDHAGQKLWTRTIKQSDITTPK